MKALIKITAAVLIGAACLGIAACNPPTNAGGGGENPNITKPEEPNPEAAKDKATVEAVKKQLTIQETVIKTQTEIVLPKSESGAKITWTSNNPKIIDADGKVTHQDGKGFDEVKLTATITKGKASATKTFTVKVAQKNKELSPEEAMNTVTLSVNYKKDIYEDQQIDMKTSLLVDGKTVIISSYTSNDEKHLECDNTAGKLTVRRDIADVTVQLSVKLTCEGKVRTRQLPVIIDRIPEFKHVSSENTTTFTFDGSTLTKKSSKYPEEKNAKFTYTADTKNGTITLSRTHIFKNGTFCDKNEAIAADVENNMALLNALKAAYNIPSLENFRHSINLYENEDIKTEDALINYIIKQKEYIRNCFEGLTEHSTLEDFKKLEEDKKQQGIKKFCKLAIKNIADDHHISSTEDFNRMFDEIKAAKKKESEKKLSKKFFTNKKFKYKILNADKTDHPHGVWFKIIIYDKTRSWHEQFGKWTNISEEEQDMWKLNANNIFYYYGKFNADYTEFTYSKKDDIIHNGYDIPENGTWTFENPVEASDGKVSMKAKKQGPLEEVTMEFNPDPLFL